MGMLKGDLDAEVVKNMNKGMENYEKPNFDGVTTTWDIVQKELQCCGVENSSDWANTRPDMFTAGQTPDSCCVGGQKNGCGKTDAEKKFEDGCYSLFKSKFIDNIAIIGAVALGVAASSWPLSSLLVALERGWDILLSMSKFSEIASAKTGVS